MLFSLVMRPFLLVLLSLLCVTCISNAFSDVTNCDREQYRQEFNIGDSVIGFQSSCSNKEVIELSINQDSSFKLLSKFLYPYSFSLRPLRKINSEEDRFAVIELAPSEPQPTGSYYFAVIDVEAMTLVVDGYSDSEINVYDYDEDGLEEVVYGDNLSGVNPLTTMLDFVPYPKVLDWDCYGNLRLVGNSAYPQLMNDYRKSLSNYIDQLSVKSENSSGSTKASLQAELEFSEVIMASSIIGDFNPITSLMTNSEECKK